MKIWWNLIYKLFICRKRLHPVIVVALHPGNIDHFGLSPTGPPFSDASAKTNLDKFPDERVGSTVAWPKNNEALLRSGKLRLRLSESNTAVGINRTAN